MRNQSLFYIIGVIILSLSTQAFAIPQTMTLSGQIAKPDGTALTSNNVSFKFSMTNPSATCVIYEESVVNLDLSNSAGNFEASLGSGTLTFPLDGRTLKDVLSNAAAIPCDGGGTYTPVSTDARLLTIQFIDNAEAVPAWRTFTSGIPLNSVPSAFYAGSAEKLGSNIASDFVIKTGIPTCTAGQYLTWDGTNLTCITEAGASSITALTGDVTAAGPGSSAATVAKLQGTTLTLAAPASGHLIRHNGTAFVNTTLAAGDIPNLDWAKITTGKPTTLAGYGISDAQATGSYLTALTGDVTAAGPGSGAASIAKLQGNTLTISAPATGHLLRHDGSAFVNTVLSASDIPNLNWSKITSGTPTTLSGYGITDAIASGSVTVTSPIVNLGSAAAPNISIQAATSGQNGYLSSTDFNTFNAKLSTNLNSGKVWVGNGAGVATERLLEITDIRSSQAPNNPIFTNAACTADESLYYTPVTDTFECQLVSISDGQINYTNVAQNNFFAGPTNATGTPTFRSIASADIRSFAFVNGGNSFGTTTAIGTNDPNNLLFTTNGTAKMTLDTTGKVGIGTGGPRSTLDVAGTILSSPGVSNGASTDINFLTGNMQFTNLSCQTFSLQNLKDGGSFMFVVKGTSSALCIFSAYSDAGITGLTVHMPPDHAVTTAGKHTIYNIAVLGADVYISWTPGY